MITDLSSSTLLIPFPILVCAVSTISAFKTEGSVSLLRITIALCLKKVLPCCSMHAGVARVIRGVMFYFNTFICESS